MNRRPIDKSNKKNIYCAHCEHWKEDDYPTLIRIGLGYKQSKYLTRCSLSGDEKEYYCRCKDFAWKEDAVYKE